MGKEKEMKKILLVLAAMVLMVGTALAQEASNFLLSDFENTISGGPDGTVDFGAGNGSAVQVTASTDIKHGGSQSLKVEYDAISGGYIFVAKGWYLDAKNAAWLVKPEDVDWKAYNAIAFYMYGSNSKNKIAVDIKDNGGEVWRFIIEDNFTGWKQVVCPFAEFYPRSDWQPEGADKNGSIDFPLKHYQFEPLPAGKGVLYFDDVELIKQG